MLAPPHQQQGARRVPPWVWVLAVLIILVAALGTWLLIQVPPAPSLTATVSYEANGVMSQASCGRYNATITVSVETPDANVTIGTVTFTYHDSSQTVQVTESVNLTFSAGAERSITIEIDTCRGVAKVEANTCVSFEASAEFDFTYRVGSRSYPATQTIPLSSFEICA